MPAIAVDPNRSSFLLAADTVEEVAEYGEAGTDGNRPKTGAQARDKVTGLPLWVIYVLTVVEAGQRPEICKVKVASPVAPVLGAAFTPVHLTNLEAVPWVDGRKVSLSYRCTGVDVVVAGGRKADAA